MRARVSLSLWLILVAVPLVALALLLAEPELDFRWEHHPAHFWLVLLSALASVALALVTSLVTRGDARLFLVSLAFLASAGFLALHALATPGVLLAGPNAGFVIATPVGLLIAAVFAAASSADLGTGRAAAVIRLRRALFWALIVLIAAWAAVSVAGLPPLDDPLPAEVASGPLAAAAVLAVFLYALASARYFRLHRRRPAVVLVGVMTAFAFLAEAMIAVVVARNWHATWWEWHVLMLAAFALVAGSVWFEYRREGSLTAALAPVYLDDTLRRVDRRYAAALDELVEARRRDEPPEEVGASLRREFALSSEEIRSLGQTADWVHRLETYVSPHVASRLREPREEARIVSVLFADLEGFTSFAERTSPREVVDMLNRYFEIAVAILVEEDATIDKFVGDAVMAEFNALVDQPDHAVRAARAALALARETRALADEKPAWPRFRVAINTGEAVVGAVGGKERRSLTVIGDAVNLAARLEARARAGQVVIGPGTYALLPGGTDVAPLGPIEIKGKEEPVEAYVLLALPSAGTEARR